MTGTKSYKKESEFQFDVKKYIESKGGYVVKIHVSSYESQGEPDLVCCFNGRFVAFELKKDDGKPSKLQLYKIKKIQQAGGIAKVVDNMKEIEETLNEIFRVQQDGESIQ